MSSVTSNSILIAKGDDMSILDDTITFERPIGRKAEKANRKKKASVGKYVAKKMKCIEESQEQEKESLHIKAEMIRLEELRDKERIRLKELKDKERVQLEERRILMEEERISIEWETLCIQSMVEDGRIMNKNTSGMSEAQKLYYEQRQERILARQSQSK